MTHFKLETQSKNSYCRVWIQIQAIKILQIKLVCICLSQMIFIPICLILKNFQNQSPNWEYQDQRSNFYNYYNFSTFSFYCSFIKRRIGENVITTQSLVDNIHWHPSAETSKLACIFPTLSAYEPNMLLPIVHCSHPGLNRKVLRNCSNFKKRKGK